MNNNIDPRYPIGQFIFEEYFDEETKNNFINEIEILPSLLKKEIEGFGDEQLDTQYREGGWTIRQVVHHIADSHLNAYVRLKLALTEDTPAIKTYDEKLWAELPDVNKTPVSVSLNLLENLHKRWVILWKLLPLTDLDMKFKHPVWGEQNLKWLLAQYAWHGKHHLAHITSLKEKMNWK